MEQYQHYVLNSKLQQHVHKQQLTHIQEQWCGGAVSALCGQQQTPGAAPIRQPALAAAMQKAQHNQQPSLAAAMQKAHHS